MGILFGLIIGFAVAFFAMSILRDKNVQKNRERNNKQEKTSNQAEAKINNIVIPAFLVIIFGGVFGIWFAIGGVIGIVAQNFTDVQFPLKIFAKHNNSLTRKQKKQVIVCLVLLGAILLLGFACSQSNDTKLFNIPGGFITNDGKRVCAYSESSGRWACIPNE